MNKVSSIKLPRRNRRG